MSHEHVETWVKYLYVTLRCFLPKLAHGFALLTTYPISCLFSTNMSMLPISAECNGAEGADGGEHNANSDGNRSQD